MYFYPMKPWLQNPENQGLAYEDVVLLHPRGMRIHGWWLPAEGAGDAKGTVYYLHGNAQNISTHLANVQWLPAHGYNVFMLDYRGYGLSEGKPKLPGVYDDVQLGLDWLRAAHKDSGPLTVFGQSLGGALAVTVLGQDDNQGAADCVIVEAAFASYRGITDDVMRRSWLLWPLRWLVVPGMPDHEQDPQSRIAALSPTPVMILHSEEDSIVPFSHGERLYAAAGEPKTFQPLHGGHIQSTRDPQVQARLLAFMAASGCEAAPQPEPPAAVEPAPVLPGPVVPPVSSPGEPLNGGYRF